MMRFKKLVIAIVFTLTACMLIETTYVSQVTVYAATTTAKATLKSATAMLKVKEKATITINNKQAKATYTFKSANKKIATVTKAGVITGKKIGATSITVTETYNKKKTIVGKVQVTVRPEVDMPKVLERSLVSTGNNFRMKIAIDKAMNGEEVTIAYIGGSITEGAGSLLNTTTYAQLSYDYFRDTFGKDGGENVKFVNAGMSGTPSSLGMVRYERDVLNRAESAPDIVFVEFAVNDADDTTNGDAYESLVRNILNAENQPAVVLIFSVFKTKWNLQDRLQPIGEYYDLPMISIKDAVVPELNSNALTNAEFFADEYHPTVPGHKIMADCISNYFDAVDQEAKAEQDITIPEEAKIGKSFEGIQMLDSKSKVEGINIKAGGFADTDTNLGTFKYDYTMKTFPNNWKHSTTSGKTSFKMTIDCKNLVIVYKLSSNAATAGKVDVYVDGVMTQTYTGSGGGWNNPKTMVIFNDAESAEHRIEIKMASDSATKEFSILAFGYTKQIYLIIAFHLPFSAIAPCHLLGKEAIVMS